MEDKRVDRVSKTELIERVEYILSYLLSKKHNADVKIIFKKEKITNGNSDTSRNFSKK
jgi:hypothetical protein